MTEPPQNAATSPGREYLIFVAGVVADGPTSPSRCSPSCVCRKVRINESAASLPPWMSPRRRREHDKDAAP